MPTVTNVTLTGTAPVSNTFSLTSRANDAVTWQDRAKLIPAQFSTLKIFVRQILDNARKLTGNYRGEAKIVYPIIRNVGGVDTVIDEIIITRTYRVAGMSTLAERQHALTMAKNLDTQTMFVSGYESGEGFV